MDKRKMHMSSCNNSESCNGMSLQGVCLKTLFKFLMKELAQNTTVPQKDRVKMYYEFSLLTFGLTIDVYSNHLKKNLTFVQRLFALFAMVTEIDIRTMDVFNRLANNFEQFYEKCDGAWLHRHYEDGAEKITVTFEKSEYLIFFSGYDAIMDVNDSPDVVSKKRFWKCLAVLLQSSLERVAMDWTFIRGPNKGTGRPL